MPTVIVHHNVLDKARWLASKRREEFFGPLGVTGIRTFVSPTDPTRVGLLAEVPDLDKLVKALHTQAAADAMAHDGVVPETVVMLIAS
jgi:hypothetical protein